ncbi:MAG TPA: formyl transferase [Xanthobacteraceae bacterium]|nr:formyl transferase [Xanthobacteraceae bacterium]
MRTDKVALLTCESDIGRIAACCLTARFPGLTVIVERSMARSLLLRRRVKRLGLVRVGGQLAFMAFHRVQRRASRARIAEIVGQANLEPPWPDTGELIRVPSINSPECVAHLQRLSPSAILVVGTRIIAEEVLRAVDAPFINYHAGITPKYRGVHGGYWANAEGDPGNFGITVHLIDKGIDTGDVLYQARLVPAAEDNYSTFPYLQLVAALPLLERAAHDAVTGILRPHKVDLPSRLWSHPTLWQYVKTGLRRGVW